MFAFNHAMGQSFSENTAGLTLATLWLKKRTLMHLQIYKFRPERTGFNTYAEYLQVQLTFLALHLGG